MGASTHTRNKAPRWLALAALMLLLTLNVFIGHRKSHYNWDMLPYVWLSLSYTGVSGSEATARTFEHARETVSQEKYTELTTRSHYRIETSTHPEKFEQQMRFYTVKPVFPVLMASLVRLGAHPIYAGQIVVAIACVLLGLVTFALNLRQLSPAGAAALAYLLVTCPPVLQLTRLFTPDALSALCVVTGCYLHLERASRLPTIATMLLGVFVRPDSVMLCGLYIGFMTLSKRLKHYELMAALAALGSTYWISMGISQYFGWANHFYVTFVDRIVDIDGFVSPLGLRDYLELYPKILTRAAQVDETIWIGFFGAGVIAAQSLVGRDRRVALGASALGCACHVSMRFGTPLVASIAGTVCLLAVLLVIGLLCVRVRALLARDTLETGLLVVLVSFLLVHFVLFPADNDRMLAGPYIVVGALTVGYLWRTYRGHIPRRLRRLLDPPEVDGSQSGVELVQRVAR